MKFTILILCSIFFFSLHSFSQNTRKFDPNNARDGENVEYCHQHIKMAELLKNPEYVKANEAAEAEFQEKLRNPVEKGVVYKIPVVFMFFTAKD